MRCTRTRLPAGRSCAGARTLLLQAAEQTRRLRTRRRSSRQPCSQCALTACSAGWLPGPGCSALMATAAQDGAGKPAAAAARTRCLLTASVHCSLHSLHCMLLLYQMETHAKGQYCSRWCRCICIWSGGDTGVRGNRVPSGVGWSRRHPALLCHYAPVTYRFHFNSVNACRMPSL